VPANIVSAPVIAAMMRVDAARRLAGMDVSSA
jgi:hypothetical protein